MADELSPEVKRIIERAKNLPPIDYQTLDALETLAAITDGTFGLDDFTDEQLAEIIQRTSFEELMDAFKERGETLQARSGSSSENKIDFPGREF